MEQSIIIKLKLPISKLIKKRFEQYSFMYNPIIISKRMIQEIVNLTAGIHTLIMIEGCSNTYRANHFLYSSITISDNFIIFLDEFIENTGENYLFLDDEIKNEVESQIYNTFNIKNNIDQNNEVSINLIPYYIGDSLELINLDMLASLSKFYTINHVKKEILDGEKNENKNDGDSIWSQASELIINLEPLIYKNLMSSLDEIGNPIYREEITYNITKIIYKTTFELIANMVNFENQNSEILKLFRFIDENHPKDMKKGYIVDLFRLIEIVSSSSFYIMINKVTNNALGELTRDNLMIIPNFAFPLLNEMAEAWEFVFSYYNRKENFNLPSINQTLEDIITRICNSIGKFVLKYHFGSFNYAFNNEFSSEEHGINVDIEDLVNQSLDFLYKNNYFNDPSYLTKTYEELIRDDSGIYYFVRKYIEGEILHSYRIDNKPPDWINKNGKIDPEILKSLI